MRTLFLYSAAGVIAAAPLSACLAQDNPSGDPVVQRIYDEGMRNSQAARLAQVLMDSIGPRLTGSPANRAANDWLVRTYAAWGINAKNEQYGTWRDWTRGPSSLELITPRRRVLEATMHAWSAATPAGGVTADVVTLPHASEIPDSAALARWSAGIKGKIVLASAPLPSCRPDSDVRYWADSAVYAHARAQRDSATEDWNARLAAAHVNGRTLGALLERAGAAAILSNSWSRGWGVDKIQSARSGVVPSFDVSCEDYTLLARLADHGQHPRVHAAAEATIAANESPVFNTIGRIDGSEKPNEYVMLSAHVDSWDSGSGATDNGTGTITMLEAMRILKTAYPQPKRTILVGHWSGEEEGEIGSSAFVADHPDIIAGLQAQFTQDNGTGEIDSVQTNGFLNASGSLANWLSRMPANLTRNIALMFPGRAHNESTDSDPFDCKGAPAFFLTSSDWSYTDYTWHTNRDTYDKVNFDEVKRNATLVALFAYEASEDPTFLSRARRVPPTDPQTGQPSRVPPVRDAAAELGGGPTSVDVVVNVSTRQTILRIREMNTLDLDKQLNALIIARKSNEAFLKFYDEDVVAQENDEPERKGREEWMTARASMETSIKKFEARVLAHAASGDTSFSEWEYDVELEGMGHLLINQVSVRRWKNGRVVRERFYHK